MHFIRIRHRVYKNPTIKGKQDKKLRFHRSFRMVDGQNATKHIADCWSDITNIMCETAKIK